jgi:hypothetical protein
MKFKSFTSIITALFVLCGCKSLSPETLASIAGLAETAVRVGTTAALKAHPEYRPAFISGVSAIDGLLATEGWSVADFKAALRTLPMSVFTGEYSSLAIEGIVTILNFKTLIGYDVRSSPAMVVVLTSVRNGVSDALNPTAAAARGVTIAVDGVQRKAPKAVRIVRI